MIYEINVDLLQKKMVLFSKNNDIFQGGIKCQDKIYTSPSTNNSSINILIKDDNTTVPLIIPVLKEGATKIAAVVEAKVSPIVIPKSLIDIWTRSIPGYKPKDLV